MIEFDGVNDYEERQGTIEGATLFGWVLDGDEIRRLAERDIHAPKPDERN